MLIEASRLSVLGAPVSRVVEIDFVSIPDIAKPAVVQPSKFNNNFAMDRVFELEYVSYAFGVASVDTSVRTTADGNIRLVSDGTVRVVSLSA